MGIWSIVRKLARKAYFYVSLKVNRHDRFTTLYNDFVRIVECVLFTAQVKCVLCGWTGFRFRACSWSNYSLYNVSCPACNSLPRQRILAKWFLENHAFSPKGMCLDFSPRGTHFGSLVTDMEYLYVPVNIDKEGASVVVDIQALGFLEESFDLIICSHVLEHAKDDEKAILEMRRILDSKGKCIIVVPVAINQSTTVEYGRPNADEHDHYRRYGNDIVDHIRACGFAVERLNGNWDRGMEFHLGLNRKASQFFLCQKR